MIMVEILMPVMIVSGIGIVAGVLLSIMSMVMHVPVDEKQEAVREALPGANCGACGYAGCDAYAEAVSKGETEVNHCIPGGQAVKDALAEIMGVQAGDVEKAIAYVQCFGTSVNTKNKMQYIGEMTCASANQMFGGPGSCTYGCMGLGDCLSACDYDAIHIRDGVAFIDPLKCVGCSKCVRTCPKAVIAMQPANSIARVSCSSRDKGGEVRKICQVGCTGCTRCVRICPEGAIKVENFLSRVDPEKCTACGKCVEECPQKCLHIA